MSFNYVSLPVSSIYQLLDENSTSVVNKANQAVTTSATKSYNVRGYSTAEAAKNALMTYLYTAAGSQMPTYEGLPLCNIDVVNTEVDNLWRCDCSYAPYEPLQNAIVGGLLRSNYVIPTLRQDQVSFSNGSESKHLYYSYDTQWNVKGNIQGDTSPLKSFYNAIGVQENAVTGVDVPATTATMSVEFFAPKDWLSSTVTIPSGSWLIKHGSNTTVGEGEYTRFQVLGYLCGAINQFSWTPFSLEKGCVKFSNWEARPTFFDTKSTTSGNRIKDWYYSVNMQFDYVAPKYITTKNNVDYTAEGWSYVWQWGQQMFDQYRTRQVGFKQYTCDQILEYGNFNYLGFNWWT